MSNKVWRFRHTFVSFSVLRIYLIALLIWSVKMQKVHFAYWCFYFITNIKLKTENLKIVLFQKRLDKLTILYTKLLCTIAKLGTLSLWPHIQGPACPCLIPLPLKEYVDYWCLSKNDFLQQVQQQPPLQQPPQLQQLPPQQLVLKLTK